MIRMAWLAVVLGTLVGAIGCHNTGQGIKDDTRNALHKTGHAIEKTGDKIEGGKK